MSSEMKRMFVVSKGNYSDYRVLAICDSKQTAKTIASRYNATETIDEARVESLAYVDDPNIQRVEVLSLTVTIWDNGTESQEGSSHRVEWPFDPLYDDLGACTWRWVRAPIHGGKGGRLDVRGTDHERVRKVFGERRALLHSDDAFRSKKEINGRGSE